MAKYTKKQRRERRQKYHQIRHSLPGAIFGSKVKGELKYWRVQHLKEAKVKYKSKYK